MGPSWIVVTPWFSPVGGTLTSRDRVLSLNVPNQFGARRTNSYVRVTEASSALRT